MPSAKQKTSVFAKNQSKSRFFHESKSNSKLSSFSSSSNNSPLSSETSLSNYEEDEQEKRDFFQDFYETDSESLEEEEPAYASRPTLEAKVEFLKDFGSVPDLDKISDDVSAKVSRTNTIEAEYSPQQQSDVGYFVDPLTGNRILSISSVSVVKKELPKLEDNKQGSFATFLDVEEVDIEEEADEIEDLILDFSQEEDKDLNTLIDEEKALETFFQMEIQKQTSATDHNVDWEAILKQQQQQHLCESISKLLNDLIDKVVESAEYINPEVMLRKNLDKHKLISEISKTVRQRNVERSVCEFLNRKVLDYFKRKKIFRSIMPDSKRYAGLEMRKYYQTIQHLDDLLAKEASVKLMALQTKQKLENDLSEARERSERMVAELENVMRRSLYCETRPRCNVLIEKLLIEMAKCRQEVNEVRFELILKQHSEANLKEKLSKIEDLGNGLTMKSFEGLHNETQILDHKIEERNIELRKLHERLQRDIHAMAHYKEQQKMLRNSMMAQRLAMGELLEEKQQLRQRIYELRMKRNRIRKQLQELSFESGLLDKPFLMLDYDETHTMIVQQRDTVNCLQKKIRELERKIKRIEDGVVKKRNF